MAKAATKKSPVKKSPVETKVILKNKGQEPFQASLFHHLVCARREICTCIVTYPEGRKGPPIYQEASFRLNIGETSKPLPVAVKAIPQVKTALKTGRLVLVDQRVEVEKIR